MRCPSCEPDYCACADFYAGRLAYWKGEIMLEADECPCTKCQPPREAKTCGNCDCFVWNGTRFGGVCNNTAGALFNQTLSCLRDGCDAHQPVQP